jgi:hypothetical protein
MKAQIQLAGCLLTLAAACGSLAATRPAEASSQEQFFIISSVDAARHQLLLKKPTEVTEVVMLDAKTVCLNEAGKTIDFTALRAGDTVYVTFASGSDRVPLARRIRKAPMTVEELHRRYLSGS